ncbi:MAG: hypothetical protein A2474_02890 [Elusimicrobia bacterium RIFOXYC2_FULL_34_12]|nr:MAG: hypothetical protein A2474_02890 [Elusimicrobia bacterium RIFOXYC2_FULL_34_12]OGS39640.1 MAG: hypothetical protein A2551_03645 [Elusimicrobia bacterium RIFOXYD2_FULL_34_30]HAM37787.1 aminodeoxychorismate synthase, component I [Elusimicrobiota bacterium]
MTKPFVFNLNSEFIPLEIFHKISVSEKYSFFLDSVEKSRNADCSIIGYNADTVIKSKDNIIEIYEYGKIRRATGNPIKILENIFNKKAKIYNKYNCFSGAIGYFSYDIKQFFEKLPSTVIDDLKLPDLYFAFCKNFLIFNHKTGKISALIYSKTKENADAELNDIYQKLSKSSNYENHNKNVSIKSNLTKKRFKEIVIKAKEYIKEGDIFQANLSQRLQCKFYGNPYLLYKKLRSINPSPFSCFLNFPELKIFGCSPERLLKIENDKVITRPIAGTYPRGVSKKQDEKLKTKLLNDKKEKAEHIMLVDLERNDLGRVCKYGTVKVSEMMISESYSHVTHIVSNVTGIIRKNKNIFDVIASMFPGGTITGCPKIRCMEIIDELEPTARGPYTGSCGWIDYKGNCDFNILIRTFILKDKKLFFQVGAGIVADSNPEKEYYETLNKAKAMIKALEDSGIAG